MKKVTVFVLSLISSFFCVFPVLWQFASSLKTEAQLESVMPLLPAGLFLGNYFSVFTKTEFSVGIYNSLIVAAAATVLSIGIGGCAAFALAKLKVPYTDLLLLLLLGSSMFPQIATVSPLYLMVREVGIRDTLLALILVDTAFSLPLSIWVLQRFIASIPDEIYSASRIDGCSVVQSFYKIVLPLSTPGITATAILVFLFSWNEFLFALTFSVTSNSRTVPVSIAMFEGMHVVPWGEIAAASITAVFPVLLLVLFFQRYIVYT